MIECTNCGEEIDGTTDDNYNSDHSKIKCPKCGLWQFVDNNGEIADLMHKARAELETNMVRNKSTEAHRGRTK